MCSPVLPSIVPFSAAAACSCSARISLMWRRMLSSSALKSLLTAPSSSKTDRDTDGITLARQFSMHLSSQRSCASERTMWPVLNSMNASTASAASAMDWSPSSPSAAVSSPPAAAAAAADSLPVSNSFCSCWNCCAWACMKLCTAHWLTHCCEHAESLLWYDSCSRSEGAVRMRCAGMSSGHSMSAWHSFMPSNVHPLALAAQQQYRLFCLGRTFQHDGRWHWRLVGSVSASLHMSSIERISSESPPEDVLLLPAIAAAGSRTSATKMMSRVRFTRMTT
mmetsp:Transcript_10757/g.34209  ORF Transcript_10757/g.34209 Transcript_10757/m.34209 type:complete len:279 (+) Transcript_10757:352-1188(+)